MRLTRHRRPPAAILLAIALAATTALSSCGQGGNESIVTLTGTEPPTPVGSGVPQAPSTDPAEIPTPAAGGEADGKGKRSPRVIDTIAQGLAVPWGLDFFANGDAIVTERDTKRVLLISGDRRHRVSVLGIIDEASPAGEGGLLGVALSPDFEQDRAVYFYLTTAVDNRIVRSYLLDGGLAPVEVLLDGIPNGFIHDGGRLAFGPDGYLYASTGESGKPALAQDRDSLGGKILRITTDGDPAPGNPFGTAVWSYGHRNVQGLAFDQRGDLWASEFGGDLVDELNKVEPGANYGWPRVEGPGGGRKLTDPQQTWAVADASPSGLAYADGYLWMAALQGERLWRVRLKGGEAVDQTPYFVGSYGRMRTIARAPDGTLWLTTSNRDGRGDPVADDDRILHVRP
ncbi:MAG: PQQ-dependent sugar dehydrogenase [Nocardioides sp.]